MKIIDRWQRRCTVGLGLLLLVAAAQAQTNPFAKGPDPTSASLNATAGPFAVATTSVSSLVTGFGVFTINTNSTFDQPPSRATQLMAALRYLTNSSNASHFAPNSTNTPIGRYSVAWVKRFMDNDTRYKPAGVGAAAAERAKLTAAPLFAA